MVQRVTREKSLRQNRFIHRLLYSLETAVAFFGNSWLRLSPWSALLFEEGIKLSTGVSDVASFDAWVFLLYTFIFSFPITLDFHFIT